MAQAYVPIQTYTLTSTSSSVTFSNIPQNYTDLIIKVSSRDTFSGGAQWNEFVIKYDGGSNGGSWRALYGTGSAAASTSNGSTSYVGESTQAGVTANTFSNCELYIPNYTTTGSTKYISAEVVVENNGTGSLVLITATTMTGSASAITTLTLTPTNSGNFTANSTFTLYGIGGARASGGTITADAKYTYHTFTSTGTFTALEKIKDAQLLLIGGGGAGGSVLGAGGGAGGIAFIPGQTLNAGASFTAVVGAGGSATAGTFGAVGSNSTFSSFSGLGGGGGSSGGQGTFPTGNGGSGGGGGNGFSGGTATQPSVATVFGYGNNGGGDGAAAGGGGAGAVGGQNFTYGADGGAGSALFDSWARITNTGVLFEGLYYYAGGGAGSQDRYNQGSRAGGIGGVGGGGNGADAGGSSSAGTANTGSGGGGGGNNSGLGSSGGSGLVIIRYPN